MFFFSSRRRHTRYWRDWSSDVCSSDLFFQIRFRVGLKFLQLVYQGLGRWLRVGKADRLGRSRQHVVPLQSRYGAVYHRPLSRDRKSVGQGKSVDFGGRRIIKKKQKLIP